MIEINLTTVADYGYLANGIALYKSLLNYSHNFKLHYLCIDDKSHAKLIECGFEQIIVYHINDLLNNDQSLLELKNSNYKYFCWSLASYFTQYLMLKLNLPLIYIDSDIFFYKNINELHKLMENKSIGIFKHRQFLTETWHGYYNVGVCYFNNDAVGKNILNWWADAVLHKKYPHLATCGDQKYLDKFPSMCPNDLFFDESVIGHGAPWLWQLYDYSDFNENGNIIWNGIKQQLYFTHFSQFIYKEDTYIPSAQHHEYVPLHIYKETPALKHIYDEYYSCLKNIHNKYLTSDFYNAQVNKHGYWWSGDYGNWDSAEKECIGYSCENIVEQVKNTILKTKDCDNLYERDGCVIHGEPIYAFELLHWIKQTAVANEINLIDFGGSLGTTYFQLKNYLKEYNLRWNIIEQNIFVAAGKKFLEDDNLKFYRTIDECLTESKPNCFISSSVFPYIKNTEQILKTVFNYNIDWILLDRMSVIEGDKDRLCIQIVPPGIYKAIYPCWFFGENKFVKFIVDNGYKHLKTFDALGGNINNIKTSAHKGYIFKRL